MYILIVSGLSGAGKSVSIKVCEDMGFYCVDNLPTALIQTFTELSVQSHIERVALGIDVREGAFFDGLMDCLDDLVEEGHEVDILFLDAQDEMLVRRYSESRRRHPLAHNGSVPMGIMRERKLLNGLRQRATRVVDTSGLNVHELRAIIQEAYHTENNDGRMYITVQSFGFKYGLPLNSDLVFDVRFLPNPHFVPDLRAATGQGLRVAQYVLDNPMGHTFLQHLKNFLAALMPLYDQEGKAYLTISMGCTGGRHRSVAISETITQYLNQSGYRVVCEHRDVNKMT